LESVKGREGGAEASIDRVQSEWRRTGSQKFDCIGLRAWAHGRDLDLSVSYFDSHYFINFSSIFYYWFSHSFALSFPPLLLLFFFSFCFSPPVKDTASAKDALTPY